MTDQRTRQLDKRFHDVLDGNIELELRPSPCRLFLEGLCVQTDPAKCVNHIVGSARGVDAVQKALHSDLGVEFLNGLASDVLEYLLRANSLGGDVLNDVIVSIVDPPIFWSAFYKAFEDNILDQRAQGVFANVLSYLLQMENRDTAAYRDLASRPSILDKILASNQQTLREFGYLIKHILSSSDIGDSSAPGGRHDNDFADFRKVTIIPTADELLSQRRPALWPASLFDDPERKDSRLTDYLDIMFRLLREDMMHELKEEVDIVLKKKQGRHRGIIVNNVRLAGVYTGAEKQSTHWGLKLRCYPDLFIFKGVKEGDRKKIITGDRGSRILRHQSLACLVADDTVLSLGTIHRDEDLLAKKPPVVVLQIEGQANISRTLVQLKLAKQVRLIQIDTALFAFEPVLKALQKVQSLPLCQEILFWEAGASVGSPPMTIPHITSQLAQNPSMDLQPLLNTQKSIKLDVSQARSLVTGLNQKLSLIQGPPGTGKSFIGALLAKALHDSTQQTILVVCYTNHALDQFLEDLIHIGINSQSIVRLGGRPNSAVAHLSIHNLPREKVFRTRSDWIVVDSTRLQANDHQRNLLQSLESLTPPQADPSRLLAYIQTKDVDYFNALRVPKKKDGMSIVGPNGKPVTRLFLISRWMEGQDAWNFKSEPHVQSAERIWNMPKALRQQKLDSWMTGMIEERAEAICAAGRGFNDCQDTLARTFGEGVVAQLRRKRIIGCTTTGAAKYVNDITAVSPDVLLVEEAGEILESHIVTALGTSIKQMILIGDHKQLRPKVNSYDLTVERGKGYDLNRSLFERLVLKGFPHVTLSVQHRMRPEISAFIRALTYPELEDALQTKTRENIRGLQSNIVFIDHDHPEEEEKRIFDRTDGSSPASKQNTFEVKMVLRVVRYLVQQGYGNDNIVILTPYLGQLSLLREAFKNETGTILSDLDSNDLSRAGLLGDVNSQKKTGIRLATIDNYQGEESDIIVASLCRSNPLNIIGFMSSPERLNVLISRARNGLILIGNSSTFEFSRKGGRLWTQFFDLLRSGGYMYKGLPITCQRHPSVTREIGRPEDFDVYSPDGGCTESW
ncbi:P-loop containing nucleoside triphosphate hydrolase protein [Scleroderma citrinum]